MRCDTTTSVSNDVLIIVMQAGKETVLSTVAD